MLILNATKSSCFSETPHDICLRWACGKHSPWSLVDEQLVDEQLTTDRIQMFVHQCLKMVHLILRSCQLLSVPATDLWQHLQMHDSFCCQLNVTDPDGMNTNSQGLSPHPWHAIARCADMSRQGFGDLAWHSNPCLKVVSQCHNWLVLVGSIKVRLQNNIHLWFCKNSLQPDCNKCTISMRHSFKMASNACECFQLFLIFDNCVCLLRVWRFCRANIMHCNVLTIWTFLKVSKHSSVFAEEFQTRPQFLLRFWVQFQTSIWICHSCSLSVKLFSDTLFWQCRRVQTPLSNWPWSTRETLQQSTGKQMLVLSPKQTQSAPRQGMRKQTEFGWHWVLSKANLPSAVKKREKSSPCFRSHTRRKFSGAWLLNGNPIGVTNC